MWLMTKGARLSTIISLLTTYLLTTKISISTLMSILSLKCHLFNLMEHFFLFAVIWVTILKYNSFGSFFAYGNSTDYVKFSHLIYLYINMNLGLYGTCVFQWILFCSFLFLQYYCLRSCTIHYELIILLKFKAVEPENKIYYAYVL